MLNALPDTELDARDDGPTDLDLAPYAEEVVPLVAVPPAEESQGGATLAAAVSGAALGGAAGATLGPIGAAVGVLVGATVGAFVGIGLEDVGLIVAERERESGETHELDDESATDWGDTVVDEHPATERRGPDASCSNG